MAQFPIQFAERVPPPAGPGVRATVDPRVHIPAPPPPVPTGEAEEWRALAGLGGALADVGEQFLNKFQIARQRVQDAEDAIAVSEGKRKYDERMNLARQAAAGAPDETAVLAIGQKALTDVATLPTQSRTKRVRDELTIYHNQQASGQQMWFATKSLAIKKSNALAQAEVDYAAKKESGDVAGVRQNRAMMALLDPINRAKYQQQEEDAPFDTSVALIRNAIAVGDVALAKTLIEQVPMKALRNEQLEDMTRLSTLLNQQESRFEADYISDLSGRMAKLSARNASPMDIKAFVADEKQRIVGSGWSGDKQLKWSNELDRWEEGNRASYKMRVENTINGNLQTAATEMTPKQLQIYVEEYKQRLPDSDLSNVEQQEMAGKMDRFAKGEMTAAVLEFESQLNADMILANQEELTGEERVRMKEGFDDRIVASDLPANEQVRLLARTSAWWRDAGEIDWEMKAHLEGRVNRVLGEGVSDPTLAEEIDRAFRVQVWGRRGTVATAKYEALKQRLASGKSVANWKATEPARALVRTNAFRDPEGARSIALFDEELREELAAHPEWDTAKAIEHAINKAAVFDDLIDTEIQRRLQERIEAQRKVNPPIRPSEAERDALPSGTEYVAPDGSLRTKD